VPGLTAFVLAAYAVVWLGFGARTTGDVERMLGRPLTSSRELVTDHRATFERA
jgi:hypothetical protein